MKKLLWVVLAAAVALVLIERLAQEINGRFEDGVRIAKAPIDRLGPQGGACQTTITTGTGAVMTALTPCATTGGIVR